jgi:N-hydroxyarylamine O-acetyltransferase
MDADRYLDRIGLDPDAVAGADRETLRSLQRAHVTAVPFETLSITGDPHGPRDGEGVSLDPANTYEKVVERRRGGFCYELNGLFGRLLRELGYDPDRVAARVVNDGAARPPANHLSHVVEFDRRYVVDVGIGVPTMRRPTPLDGEVREDAAGVEWRVVESDRPDAAYVSQYRTPGGDAGDGQSDDAGDGEDADEQNSSSPRSTTSHEDADGWSDRYVFDVTPRGLDYVAATCDYLQTAPESSLTGSPTVSIATDDGHLKVTAETMTEFVEGERHEWPVTESEWYDALDRVFGIRYRSD